MKKRKTKFMYVEDGSTDIDALKETIKDNNLPIAVIVYRQGARTPMLIDTKKENDK